MPWGAKAWISATTSACSAFVATGFRTSSTVLLWPSAWIAAVNCSRSAAEIGGSTETGFTGVAGVTATGIRGALGISLLAAKAASALDPLGVEPRVGIAIAVLLDDVTVDEVTGFPVVFFVVVVAKIGGVVFDGVIALVFKVGGSILLGWIVWLFSGSLVFADAHKPPEPPCNFFKRTSTEGLKSAGIKIRIGLAPSIHSPRCPGFNWYSSARLKPVIDATSFRLTAPTVTSLKCGRLAIGGKLML